MYDIPRKHDWEKRAKCLEIEAPTDDFYPPRDKALYAPVARRAKAVCKGKDGLPPCPVKRDCLMDAIERDEIFGIWGGQSHRERNALIRKAEATGRSITDLVDALDRTWDNGDDE